MPALEEPIVRMETYNVDEPAPAKLAAEEGEIAPAATVKAAKAPSSKAKKLPGPRRLSPHPPYAEVSIPNRFVFLVSRVFCCFLRGFELEFCCFGV